MKNHDKDWKNLMERLYFVEGIEDIRMLYGLTDEAARKWCSTRGERICTALFGLCIGADPRSVLTNLQNDEEEDSERVVDGLESRRNLLEEL